MKVPARIFVNGDKTKARDLIGVAKSRLRITDNERQLRGFKEHWSTVRYDDGTVIECYCGFNMDYVNVYVPPKQGGKLPTSECFCNQCFSIGTIWNLSEGKEYNLDTVTFDVEICQKDYYIAFINVKPSDFAQYQPDDLVYVIPVGEADVSMCCDTTPGYRSASPCHADAYIIIPAAQDYPRWIAT